MFEYIRGFLRRGLTRRLVWEGPPTRRLRVQEDVPPERFVTIILLMVVFFAGLVYSFWRLWERKQETGSVIR